MHNVRYLLSFFTLLAGISSWRVPCPALLYFVFPSACLLLCLLLYTSCLAFFLFPWGPINYFVFFWYWIIKITEDSIMYYYTVSQIINGKILIFLKLCWSGVEIFGQQLTNGTLSNYWTQMKNAYFYSHNH